MKEHGLDWTIYDVGGSRTAVSAIDLYLVSRFLIYL